MIASIASHPHCDVDLFLEEGELGRLGREVLNGVLIRARQPSKQGLISLEVSDDKARKSRNNHGIGYDSSNYWVKPGNPFKLALFMQSYIYSTLVANGRIGLAFNLGCMDDIEVFDASRISGPDRWAYENLVFARNNRERYEEMEAQAQQRERMAPEILERIRTLRDEADSLERSL